MRSGKRGDLEEALRKSIENFNQIEVDGPGTKPLIGIVGEIFVRLNPFANENVIRKIEQFGGEAWIAPLTEWILYVNTIAKGRSLRKRSFSNLLKVISHGLLSEEGRTPIGEDIQRLSQKLWRTENQIDF